MRKFVIGSLITGALLVSTVAIALNNTEVKEVEGYSSTTITSITTIDLNDTSDADIRNYYSSLNSLGVNERKGTNLLKNLKPILKNNQQYFKYDNSGLWALYEITDRDWERSPASSTTYGTYNEAQNKLVNYQYGTSSSNKKNNPYIHALYVNRGKNDDNQTDAWSDHNQDQWGINQEHVWPKSQGFEASGAGGARGDPMHLMAGNGYANNIHSNYFYGYVDQDASFTDCGQHNGWTNLTGNLRGSSKTIGNANDLVFEPQESDKGDIARAIFYMVARYNYLSGSDSDGIDQNNPNLELVQNNVHESTSYTSSTSRKGQMGILTDLLAWHHADPVDDYEIHRNNLLYTNYTKNRNPFIDFPEWVDFIWGTVDYTGSTFNSYNSTPSGYATPSSDTINGYNDADPVAVTGVSLNKSSTSIKVGKTETLVATVAPSNASDKSVTWSSSDTTVATVSNGTVTGVKAGSATITVTTTDGNKTATCDVTVTATTPTETSDATMAVGTNASTATVNGNTAIKVGTSGKVGDMTITVGTGATSLTFKAASWKGTSNVSLSLTGAEVTPSSVTLTADDGISNSSPFTLSGDEDDFAFEFELEDINEETTITLSSEKRFVVWDAKYTVSLVPTSITATAKKNFSVGETITKANIIVEDNFGNEINDYDFDNYQFTYSDAASGGALTNKNFTIEYDDLSTTLVTKVKRESYTSSISDLLNQEVTEVTSAKYTAFSNVTVSSSTIYAGQCAGSNGTIQLRSSADTSNNYSGIISTRYGGLPRNVSVTWNSGTADERTLNIYGKNTPYTSANDLYVAETSGTKIGTIVYGTSTELDIVSDYKYIGIRSNSGALYLDDITIEYEVTNLTNYVMFEDTANQCLSKLDRAKDAFIVMSLEERYDFMNGTDYCTATARERFEAWLTNQGQSISHVNGDYVINEARIISQSSNIVASNGTIIVVLISALSVSVVVAFVTLRKRKEE